MATPTKRYYEFGPYRLDVDEHLLLRDGVQLSLTLKTYEILLLLVQNVGRMIEKGELMDKVWPNTFVDEANLTQNIFMLRKVLGANPEGQKYIETVPRRGYRFAAAVREVREGAPDSTSAHSAPPAPGDAASPPPPPIVSLAVLPLVKASNGSHAPNGSSADYLAEGITESLINNLSQLPHLNVMAWSTVVRVMNDVMHLQDVGHALHVQTVLTGRVLQLGDRIIIRIELVDIATGCQIWGEQYNRVAADLLTLQEDIAAEIASRLRRRLSAATERNHVNKYHTHNPEAQQLYLKGRFHWNKRTAEGLQKGISYLQQATEKDPNYALGYAGLADCYTMLGNFSVLPPREAFAQAKVAVTRALELDDSLAEAHTSLGMIRMLYDWEWLSAEKEFKLAVKLNPNYALAHHWYGKYLARMARFPEALAELHVARDLEPLSLSTISSIAGCYYLARQPDRAIETCREALELSADYGATYGVLGLSYALKQMYPESIAHCQKTLKVSHRDPEVLAFLGNIYAASGEPEKAYELLDELREMSRERYVSPFYTALICVGLREDDQALEWLGMAYEERSDMLTYLKVLPMFAPLHADKRFAYLLRRVGLTLK